MQFLKDPLILFLFIGVILFAGTGLMAGDDEGYAIVVTPADVQRLRDQWAAQMRRPATERRRPGS